MIDFDYLKCQFCQVNVREDVIQNSSYSNTDNSHADTSISGSFCPLTTGNYQLSFLGRYNYGFRYTFVDESGDSQATISRTLYKNYCYYFYLLANDERSASVTFQVTYNGIEYIPNARELISCKYNGALQASSEHTLQILCKSDIYLFIIGFIIN